MVRRRCDLKYANTSVHDWLPHAACKLQMLLCCTTTYQTEHLPFAAAGHADATASVHRGCAWARPSCVRGAGPTGCGKRVTCCTASTPGEAASHGGERLKNVCWLMLSSRQPEMLPCECAQRCLCLYCKARKTVRWYPPQAYIAAMALEEEWPDSSDIAAERAAQREAATPLPERVWALRNVAATLALGGPGELSRARQLLEKALQLKEESVKSATEHPGARLANLSGVLQPHVVPLATQRRRRRAPAAAANVARGNGFDAITEACLTLGNVRSAVARAGSAGGRAGAATAVGGRPARRARPSAAHPSGEPPPCWGFLTLSPCRCHLSTSDNRAREVGLSNGTLAAPSTASCRGCLVSRTQS